MKYFPSLSILFLFGAAPVLFGASKEIIELQRDVSLLQDQVRTLNDKITSLTTMVQQAIDNTRQANVSIGVMQDRFNDTLKKQQEGVVAPVLGVGTKLDQMSEDFRGVRETVLDMNTRISKLDAKIADVQNSINILKSPPPPPPGASAPPTGFGSGPGGASAPGSPATSGPPSGMSAEAAYTNAYRDYVGGNYDLAMQEFTDYVKYFNNTQFAPNAQYYIGDIYYKRKDYDNAIQAFDAVLEHYSDNSKTPDSHLMKGRSLQAEGKRDAAAREYKEVVNKYPDTEAAAKAKSLLKELGLSAASSKRKKTR